MKKILPLVLMFFALQAFPQGYSGLKFKRADSLRGALRPQRTCYDVNFYHLNLDFDLDKKSIKGYCEMRVTVKKPFRNFQIDLFDNLIIDSITHGGRQLEYTREHQAVFPSLSYEVATGKNEVIRIYYHGQPQAAQRPPWDGGFVWETDDKDNQWVGVTCEGTGASCWWPNKDHLSDEPDSMRISLTVPKSYQAISNGRLQSVQKNKGRATWHWKVVNPINNYNVTFYIGKFAHIHDEYKGLDLDYYVLKSNKKQAIEHFEQVKGMMDAFEHYFGPYPFKEDGYKLVESPYWGMEHQSAVAYGNKYKNNKWGFDFIIVHESGHEWWGNNLSMNDHADMWIHEAFTTYSELLYLEHSQGYDVAMAYLKQTRAKIVNNAPIRGPYNVNFHEFGSADMYYKGAAMLHTFRIMLSNDELWFSILKGLQKRFRHQNVSSDDIITYINKRVGTNMSKFFKQYLDYAELPTVEYMVEKTPTEGIVHYRYVHKGFGYRMPIRYLAKDGTEHWVTPSWSWRRERMNLEDLENFRFDTENLLVVFKEIESVD